MSSMNYCNLFLSQQFLIGKEWPQMKHLHASYDFSTAFYWIVLCLQHSVLHYWFPIISGYTDALRSLIQSADLLPFKSISTRGACSNVWNSSKTEREICLSRRNVYEVNVSIRYESYDFPVSGVNRNNCGEIIVFWLTESAELEDALSTTRGPLLERHCVTSFLHITRICKILKHSIVLLTPHNM
jgi:hypothetical protein